MTLVPIITPRSSAALSHADAQINARQPIDGKRRLFMTAARYIVFNTVYAISGLTLAMLAVLAFLRAFPAAA